MTQQLLLTAAWQRLGNGPLLVQVFSGNVLVVASSTIPTAASTNGTLLSASLGLTANQFTDTGEYWAKAVTTGAVINVVTAATAPASSVSSGSQDGLPISELSLLDQIAEGIDALPATLGSPAQDGADVAGIAMPAGGAGIRGWLSASYGRLAAIAQSLTGTLKTAPQANAPRVTGSGALSSPGDKVVLAIDGMSTAVAQIAGTWVGNVAWSGSIDGTTWFPLTMTPYAGGAAANAATANGQWECACGGLSYFQAQLTAAQSGTALVTLAAASGVKSLRVGTPAGNPLIVALPDGAVVTLGARADTAATDDTSAFSLVALAKRATGFLANLAATAAATVSSGTLKVSVPGALPLPTGAATDARLAAIQAILQAQSDLATSIWTDNASPKPNFYVRRETLGASGTATIIFENADGSTANVTAASLVPLSSSDALSLVTAYFDAIAAGSGINAGDVLARIVVVNKGASPPVASTTIWLNLNQGTTLAAAPAAGSYVEQTQHVVVAVPDGAHATFGAMADAAATSDVGTFSFVALFKRALTYLDAVASTVGAGSLRVATPVPASVVAGQVKIAASGTAVPLPAAALANGVVVKASVFNAAQTQTFTAAAGGAGLTTAYDGTGGYPLAPGEAASFACANTNLVYVNGQAGDVFGYEGN